MERMSNAVRARVRDYLVVGQPSSGWSVSGNEISCGDVICAKISPQKHLWSWCGGCTYTLWPRWGPWEGRDLFYISRWAPSHNYPLPRSSPRFLKYPPGWRLSRCFQILKMLELQAKVLWVQWEAEFALILSEIWSQPLTVSSWLLYTIDEILLKASDSSECSVNWCPTTL